jgi:uncharacterized protein
LLTVAPARHAIRSIAALTIAAAAVFAADFTQLKPQGYLSDFARVVDPASRTRIERYCKQIEDQTGAQIALVTLPSLDGEEVEDVGNRLFRAWGIGQKGGNNGVLLLLAISERRSSVELGYGIEPIIPDGFAGAVLREMRPALREGHYGDAMIAAAGRIGDEILKARQVDPRAMPARPTASVRRDPGLAGIWPFLAFLAVFFLLFYLSGRSQSRRYRRVYTGGVPWWMIGTGGGGWGGHGSSHGGFGGSDGWGGFGGFGGGDSGGGGASSDW